MLSTTTTCRRTGICKIKMTQRALLASVFAVATLASEATHAGLISRVNCDITDVDTFTIDRINESTGSGYDDGTQIWEAPDAGISGDYTQCKGFYDGNDKNDGDVFGNAVPDVNIGWRDDGLLNFSEFDGLLSDGQKTQDLPGNTATDDPGWIRLAEADTDSNDISYEDINFGLTQINLADYLQFSMTFGEVGAWSLKVDPDFITLGQSLGLGYFDHLAFVVKQAKSTEKQGSPAGFAVYDFDLQEFFDLDILDPSTAYNLYGSFDLDGIHGSGFSHTSIWARDPVIESEVPAPATLALFGLGLVGLGWSRRKKG